MSSHCVVTITWTKRISPLFSQFNQSTTRLCVIIVALLTLLQTGQLTSLLPGQLTRTNDYKQEQH